MKEQESPLTDPHGLETRFGGRSIRVEVFVNTDEDEQVVTARVQEAARGPGKRMAAALGQTLSAEAGTRIWDELLPKLRRVASSRAQA